MNSRDPSVFKISGSPFFYCKLKVWDADGQRWVRKQVSTKQTTPGKARRMALRLQEVAAAAAGVDEGVSREWAEGIVNMLLAFAGAKGRTARSWKEAAARWMLAMRDSVEARSMEAYKSHLRTWGEQMGAGRAEWRMTQFTGDDMQAGYDGLVAAGRSPNTAKNILKTVAAVFAYENLPVNPCDAVIRQRETVMRTKEVFTDAEVAALRRAAERVEHGDEWQTMILLAQCTGAREDDCSKMGRANLAVKQGLQVLGYRQGKLIGKGGKAFVEVPVVEPLAGHLRGLLSRLTGNLFCPHLALLPTGGRGGLSERFAEIMRLAGVKFTVVCAAGKAGRDWKSKGFHSFRHTLPSQLANAGVPERVAMAIVGHNSNQVHRIYTHIDAQTKALALEKAGLK